MVDGISSSQTQNLQMLQNSNKKPPSAEDMFAKLSDEVGGDGKTITKDQINALVSKLESDTSGEDKGKLGFLKQLAANFDKISGGNDSITATNLKNGMDSLKPPSGGPQDQRPEFQDPNTVTSDQLQPPIDLRV